MPALTQEDRERLERIANFCAEHWDPLAKEDADFLRNLTTSPSPVPTSSQVGEEALDVVVDFLGSWRYCPVSEASAPARSCLEDAATQLLQAAAPAIEARAGEKAVAEFVEKLLHAEAVELAERRWMRPYSSKAGMQEAIQVAIDHAKGEDRA